MHLLFDFDGTLVKSYHHVIEKINLLAEPFHCRKIKEQEIESLRDLSSQELIKFLGIPFYKIPFLIRSLRQLLHDEMANMQPVTNNPKVLENFYQAECTLGILTSNSIENVELWLAMHNIRHFFDFILNESNHFSKKYLLKKRSKNTTLIKKKHFISALKDITYLALNQNHLLPSEQNTICIKNSILRHIEWTYLLL